MLIGREVEYQSDKNSDLVKLSKFSKQEDVIKYLSKVLENEEKQNLELKEKNKLLDKEANKQKFNLEPGRYVLCYKFL
jgi:hypothetical protein